MLPILPPPILIPGASVMEQISYRTIAQKAGLPPGSLVYVGKKQAEEPLVTVFDYSENAYREMIAGTVTETFPYRDSRTVSWINLSRVSEAGAVEKIGEHFRIHPLILEDILTQGQLPKYEDMEDYLVIILNMLSFDEQERNVRAEQVSIIFGINYLITFQEIEGDVFDSVRDRIRTGKGRIRRMGSDFLAYSLIDAVVDHYFVVIEKLAERIDEIEEELLKDSDRQTLHKIHQLRRELLLLRKSVWPLREMAGSLERSESPLVRDATAMYFRDVYDHIVQIIETVEVYRDMLSGILDMYFSSVSHRLNEIIRVLTIISTIFIPLTFIAGVYGMNFRYMPELDEPWAYPAIWGVMIVVAFIMLLFFRRKKWF